MSALLAVGSIALLDACTTAREHGREQRVVLLTPFELDSGESLSPWLAYKVESLGEIDPANPLAGEMATQTLSLFGREDLIASSSESFRPTGCAQLKPATNVLDEIERRARQTSIVIVNESHERSRHRAFIADVATRLRQIGYDSLAMETLSNPPASTPERYLPPFLAHPDRPFLEDEDGHYLSEAGFGRLGRSAKALGYRLVAYEANGKDESSGVATPAQRIAAREETQANNIAAYLRRHPATKLLVHVGYSHAIEIPTADGTRWLAARLKEKTGIDPLTISQTTCRGGGATRLAALPNDETPGSFDVLVDHPAERFERRRPIWRKDIGDRVVSIPYALRPKSGWRVIEARPLGDPVTSVPMDRVAIRPGEDVALMLPPGRYQVRAIGVKQSGPKE